MARFCSHGNIASQVVMELRRLGHDVLATLDAAKANSPVPDAEVMASATAEERILLSHNRRHFMQLHRNRNEPHAGMVLCTFDTDFARLAQRIHSTVSAASDMRDRLIRVNRPG